MPYATNPLDRVRTYFEDSGGSAPPVLFYTGFADPLEVPKRRGLAQALSDDFRLIFADHRGQGGSDKPRTRCLRAGHAGRGAVAVLDALGDGPRAFLGRPGSAAGIRFGEFVPERLLSLVLCGNQPYAWNLDSPTAHAVAAALAASRATRHEGFRGDLRVGARLSVAGTAADVDPGDERSRCPRGRVAPTRPKGPSRRTREVGGAVPICVGEADEMYDAAERAAAEIPGATFVSLSGHSHLRVL